VTVFGEFLPIRAKSKVFVEETWYLKLRPRVLRPTKRNYTMIAPRTKVEAVMSQLKTDIAPKE